MRQSKTPPLGRSSFLTASLCSFSNLRKDHMITIHCSLCLQQETAIKKPLTATNNAQNSTSTNRVPAHSSRHLHLHQASICLLCRISIEKTTQLTTLLLQLARCGEALTSQLLSAVEIHSSRMKMYNYYFMEMKSNFMCVLPTSL